MQNKPLKAVIFDFDERFNYNDELQKINEQKLRVETYNSTLYLAEKLKKNNVKIALSLNSNNSKAILNINSISEIVDATIDWNNIVKDKLKDKPKPDIFNSIIQQLKVDKAKTIIIANSSVGIKAAVRAHAGCIIGLASKSNHNELEMAGADFVISELSEISYESLTNWFNKEAIETQWLLQYKKYDKTKEKVREVLSALGNGYFVTRSAFEEAESNKYNYPATYMSGVYNKLSTKIKLDKNNYDKDVFENEDIVNCPDWTIFKFKTEEDDNYIDINKCKICSQRTLDFRNGELLRETIFEDKKNRKFKVETKRIVSMADYHIGAIKYKLTALDYQGKLFVITGINGNVKNENVDIYKDQNINKSHLTNYYTNILQDNQDTYLVVECETKNSKITINETAKILCSQSVVAQFKEKKSAFVQFCLDTNIENEITITKIVSLYNSLYDSSLQTKSFQHVKQYNSYDEIRDKSVQAWADIWNEMDLCIDGDRQAQKIIRLHIYHLMISFSPHNKNFDAAISARGLHGEACRGHIYWDEVFVFPLYCMHYPELAKSSLLYRYRRLPAAIKSAAKIGLKGAMFPYQSAISGYEVSSKMRLNPITNKWIQNHSHLQRHVSLAIAHNIYTYFHYTEDLDFLYNYGLEMFWEICRFWSSLVNIDDNTKRYSIYGIMGPDEFHQQNPKSNKKGLKDNAYTNIMAAWILHLGVNLFENYNSEVKDLVKKLNIKEEETKCWRHIANNMNIIIEEDIISQFDGFFALKELDFNAYKNKYKDIRRLDRILKSEALSPDEYQICKQADTLMLFYIIQDIEVTALLRSMGYNVHERYIKKNLKYYIQRTSHGSSLSKITHSHLASIIDDFELSEDLYYEALMIDMYNTRNSTSEGIHLGVMAGTILTAIFTFAGVNLTGRDPEFSQPKKPEHWKRISGKFKFRGRELKF